MFKLRAFLIAAALSSLASCGEDQTPVELPAAKPEITNVVISLNEFNNLSTIVQFEASDVDSARVLCTGAEHVEATPFFPVGDGENQIVTLGLLPSTEYTHVVQGSGALGEAESEPLAFTTEELPPFLAEDVVFEVTTPDRDDDLDPLAQETTRGFTLVNIRSEASFTVAFDDSGQIRWYREFDLLGGFGSQLANGNFAAFVGRTTGFTASFGYFAEFTPAGRIVGRHQGPVPLYTDNHELLLSPASGGGWDSHFISYDLRRIDTSRIGGAPNANIAGHQVLRLDAAGQVVFMWNAWDHFDLEDWIDGPPGNKQRTPMDFDHPNSLDIDTDGHYLLSNRNFGQIVKIHSGTGDVIWRLGGRTNGFTFENDRYSSFSAQHSARVTQPGHVLLFDNGMLHSPPVSRAVEYSIDPNTMTATLVWEYSRQPAVYSPFLGSVQRLENGSTLVGFGTTGIANEVSRTGQLLWEAQVKIRSARVGVYRFVRIASLYHYEKP